MKRYPFCALSGPANVLVMRAPLGLDLDQMLLGGSSVIGPLLVGLNKPVQIVPTPRTLTSSTWRRSRPIRRGSKGTPISPLRGRIEGWFREADDKPLNGLIQRRTREGPIFTVLVEQPERRRRRLSRRKSKGGDNENG